MIEKVMISMLDEGKYNTVIYISIYEYKVRVGCARL